MAEGMEHDNSLLSPIPESSEASITWKQKMEEGQSQVDQLQEKLVEVKTLVQGSEDTAKREFDVLWRRLKDTTTLLTYMKSKAGITLLPQLAQTLYGIRHQEGVGLIDKDGLPLSNWTKDVNLFLSDSGDEEKWKRICNKQISHDGRDRTCMSDLLRSLQIVTDLVEVLVKRVIMAETETSIEKEKVNIVQEEIKNKALQIESMSAKVEEMERFALGTNCLLNEMQQKVEDMVIETARQRQRAAENQQELSRVKRDFESLRSYVSNLISVRETLLSSEKHQTSEMLFERLVATTTQLEGEKMKRESEVQKLMAENVRLSALLDKKEAQLVAMNEQCKVMALNTGL
ncbi:hypothetical protein Syun_005339 [Stephania yunnanensis]|uniref:Uncharacterized protein n=1 Tax=Stephania yunnanensis TaxID=152371 RepID=A0AAP0Q1M4_9MAGN